MIGVAIVQMKLREFLAEAHVPQPCRATVQYRNHSLEPLSTPIQQQYLIDAARLRAFKLP
jgi:hypothetical protein